MTKLFTHVGPFLTAVAAALTDFGVVHTGGNVATALTSITGVLFTAHIINAKQQAALSGELHSAITKIHDIWDIITTKSVTTTPTK